MAYYLTSVETRTHAFLLERRLKNEGIKCELTFIPRSIMTDLCSMGVRFPECEFHRAASVIRRCALPACRVYKETISSSASNYTEVEF